MSVLIYPVLPWVDDPPREYMLPPGVYRHPGVYPTLVVGSTPPRSRASSLAQYSVCILKYLIVTTDGVIYKQSADLN
jgi:hypothetical protein